MEIKKEIEGKKIIVRPIGRLDSNTSDEFLNYLNENFTSDFEELLIDFKDIDFISSKGLRVLVSTYKGLNKQKMAITNANVSVKDVLSLSGLLKVIEIQ